MENIVLKISSSLSKIWNKILNLEKSLFPVLKEELRLEELSLTRFNDKPLVHIVSR